MRPSRGGHVHATEGDDITLTEGTNKYFCAAKVLSRPCRTWVKSGKARSEHIPSGLPPRADIVDALWHFRFVPETAVSRCSNRACKSDLFDHLVGTPVERGRHVEAERSGGLTIDH